MELIPLPKESALKERLIALNTSLSPYIDDFVALKRKMIQRLLAWDHELHGVKLNDVGTFVREGMRATLKGIEKQNSYEEVDLDRFGWVKLLSNDQNAIKIASLSVPHDHWSAQHWINKNFLSDVDRMTFVPEYCDGYIDLAVATLDSNGPFQLSDAEEAVAKIAMTVDYIRGYMGIAKTIHTEEPQDSYGSSRIQANMDDAFKAIDWLERDVLAVTQDKKLE